jgi:putative ABC transport system permease protein
MLIFKIAWRNIFRQRRRTVLTVLTMFGGFTLSSISLSLADGTYNRIINAFTRNRLGHIQIHEKGYTDRPSLYDSIHDYQKIGRLLTGISGVEAWAPRVLAAGLTSVGEKAAGANIIGVDPTLENEATAFDRKIVAGRVLSPEPSHQAVLGKGLARRLDARIGENVVIVSQAADGSIANDVYKIVGLLDSGDENSDLASCYLHITDAQNLFVLGDEAQEIVVIATSLGIVSSLTERIRQALDDPNLSVEPWQQFARSFYVAMQADKRGNWVLQSIIILIVAVGVLNTILMIVLERTREYGVLRAMGTRPFQVFRLVVLEAGLMAVLSVAAGSVAALGVNSYLSHHGIPMPAPFTYGGMEFTHYYCEVNAFSIYVPAVTVLLAAGFVSIFPALRAAHIEPAKALRTH